MLFKLAFRNAKRSIKDYLIYLITITIAVSLIFAYNSILFSKDIMELSSVLDTFKLVIIFISVIIILIIGWLINYTIGFLFHRRSKEFGTYMLLGIDTKRLARLFLLENIIIQMIAFVIGVFWGIYLFQIITIIIMNIFETPYQISIHISWKAILLTLGYIILLTFYSLIRHRRKFYKMNIKDLIYADKQNEKTIVKTKEMNGFIFCLALIMIVYSLIFYRNAINSDPEPNFNGIMLAFLILIIGIYGFYLSISNFLILIIKNKKIAYSNTNLFLVRTLTSKINTLGFTFGTLATLFTITIVALNISTTFKGVFEATSKAPIDFVVVSVDESESFENYRDYINQNFTIHEEFEYAIYHTQSSEVNRILSQTAFNGNTEQDYLIRISDYNRLLSILGEEVVILDANSFLINSPLNGLDQALLEDKYDLSFKIDGKELNYAGTKKANIPARFFSYIVVVPDNFITQQEFMSKFYVVETLEETTEQDFINISKHINPIENDSGNDYIPLGNVDVKGYIEAQNKGLITITVFTCYYLAIIFICTALTILSIQQLSDSTKYKFRYQVLDHLGISKENINNLVFKQLFYFYLVPTLLPILISFFIVFEINKQLRIYLENNYTGYFYFGQMMGIFLIVYIIYFIITYVGYIKNIRL